MPNGWKSRYTAQVLINLAMQVFQNQYHTPKLIRMFLAAFLCSKVSEKIYVINPICYVFYTFVDEIELARLYHLSVEMI